MMVALSGGEKNVANEVELKLLVDPTHLARLRRSPAIRKVAEGRSRRSQLLTIYYDTPDERLRAEGIALRVRKRGRGYVQCVKARQQGLGGVLVRREIEAPVPTETPDLALIDDDELRRLIVRTAAGRLQPVFRTEMSRSTRALRFADGTTGRLDIDTGHVTTAESSEPLCEVEIELDGGDPAPLFDLAGELLETVPLRVSTVTKAARGYALLAGKPPQPTKSGKLALKDGATVEEALCSTVQHCLDQILANEAPVLVNDHPEGVHQMRVGIRRFRTALGLFRSVLPDEQRARLGAELRWLGTELGGARDMDVFLDEIVGPVAAALPDDDGLRLLVNRLIEERESQRALARVAVSSRRFTEIILDVSAWMSRRHWRDQPLSEGAARLFQPIETVAGDVLSRRFRKVRKKARAFETATIEERHELRIDVKKLRYAVEFFRSLYGRRAVERFVRPLEKLQDSLGYLNDVSVAEGLVARIDGLGPPEEARPLGIAGGIVTGWHVHGLVAVERRLLDRLERLVDARPFWS